MFSLIARQNWLKTCVAISERANMERVRSGTQVAWLRVFLTPCRVVESRVLPLLRARRIYRAELAITNSVRRVGAASARRAASVPRPTRFHGGFADRPSHVKQEKGTAEFRPSRKISGSLKARGGCQFRGMERREQPSPSAASKMGRDKKSYFAEHRTSLFSATIKYAR